MEDPPLTSPSRIERLLELGCAYNAPLSIQAESGDELYRYKSRLLDIRRTGDSKSLIIDQPSSDGPAVALKPNTEMLLFFAVDRSRFAFLSVILGKTDFALGARRRISAVEISYPNALQSGQRRAYFRVPVPLRNPIHVECTVIGDVQRQVPEPEGDAAGALPSPRLGGRTINISVGGMFILIEEGAEHLADVGTRLALQFSLARNETPLRLNAIIRRIVRKSAAEQLKVGIEFVDTDESFEDKLAINRLYRYVAERQREILQSGSK